MRLVCATANPHKAAEMAALLHPVAVLLDRPPGLGEVIEDAPDLAGNALLKARAVCRYAGAAAVADDTGLEVDALGGAPGVFSARYAGEGASDADNTAKLLAELRGVERRLRTARFRTVVAVCFPDGRELLAHGCVEGRITESPRGAGGFGYDAVFVPEEGDGRTFAEMDAEVKGSLSHRGRALRSLAVLLSAA